MTTVVGGFFSALQILLIVGKTFGIDPFWFALGDDVFADFLAGIQFLVRFVILLHNLSQTYTIKTSTYSSYICHVHLCFSQLR